MHLRYIFLSTVVVAAGNQKRELWENSLTNTLAANAVKAELIRCHRYRGWYFSDTPNHRLTPTATRCHRYRG
jgi:hypothetical protein